MTEQTMNTKGGIMAKVILTIEDADCLGCLCQRCGENYKVDVLVSDDLWAVISPKAPPGGLLCGPCVMRKIENRGDFAAFLLRPVQ